MCYLYKWKCTSARYLDGGVGDAKHRVLHIPNLACSANPDMTRSLEKKRNRPDSAVGREVAAVVVLARWVVLLIYRCGLHRRLVPLQPKQGEWEGGQAERDSSSATHRSGNCGEGLPRRSLACHVPRHRVGGILKKSEAPSVRPAFCDTAVILGRYLGVHERALWCVPALRLAWIGQGDSREVNETRAGGEPKPEGVRCQGRVLRCGLDLRPEEAPRFVVVDTLRRVLAHVVRLVRVMHASPALHEVRPTVEGCRYRAQWPPRCRHKILDLSHNTRRKGCEGDMRERIRKSARPPALAGIYDRNNK